MTARKRKEAIGSYPGLCGDSAVDETVGCLSQTPALNSFTFRSILEWDF